MNADCIQFRLDYFCVDVKYKNKHLEEYNQQQPLTATSPPPPPFKTRQIKGNQKKNINVEPGKIKHERGADCKKILRFIFVILPKKKKNYYTELTILLLVFLGRQ